MVYYLCRWRIVIHGGIDGFSRLVVFLGASTNNRAETVLNLLKHAVRNYGIPSRVRSDKGGENRDVATFMVHHRGTNRNSHIAGRSVHNQRYVKSQELILCRARHTCQPLCYFHTFCFSKSLWHWTNIEQRKLLIVITVTVFKLIKKLWTESVL